MNRNKLIEFLSTHAIIECEILPETMSIKGNVMASGDDALDREAEENVRHQLEQGNDAAWCVAHVSAQYMGHTAHSYLGGCSYASESELWADELDNMREDAISALADEILVCATKLEEIARHC